MKKLLTIIVLSIVLLSPKNGVAQNCDTSAVGLDQNYPHVYLGSILYKKIDVTCLDSSITIALNKYVSCSSVAADGSNFLVVLPDGHVMVPKAAKTKFCTNDSTDEIVIEFNQPFFANMLGDMLVGASSTSTYIESACAKRPWLSDSIKLWVAGCFVTDIQFTSLAQTAVSSVELTWQLGAGTLYAPFPTYLFTSYQIYRRLQGQTQFLFVDSISNIATTHFTDANLPTSYIGPIEYRITAKLRYLEMGDDTASVHVVLKTSPVAYPVPFQTRLELALPSDGEKEVRIFTQQGLPIFTTKTAEFFLVIPTDAWPKGVYIIRVSGKEETMQRVVKF